MEPQADLRSALERAQTGDRTALDELVRCHRPRLEAFIHSRLGEALARTVDVQDLLQETLLRACKALDDFQARDEESFCRWLCGIAEHVILEAARRERRERRAPLDSDIATADVPSPSKVLRRDERFDRLQAALDSLPPEYREVISLVRLEGLPVREVARRMQRTPHAVSNLLLRATRKLKEVLGDTESLSLPERRLRPSGKKSDV